MQIFKLVCLKADFEALHQCKLSSATTEGSNLQVPELTQEQTDKMPGFVVWAYHAIY